MAERLLQSLKQHGKALAAAVSSKRPREDDGAPPHVLLVGLRNPGAQFAGTRHNAGAAGLERMTESWEPQWEQRDGASVARGILGESTALAVLPGSFMNLSGRSVAALARRHGVPPARICVLHDDLDLEVGRVKLKQGGSSGGHRGLDSCISQLGSAGFWRIRIGIGRPAEKSHVSDFVLERFGAAELSELAPALARVAELSPSLPAALEGDPRARQGWSFSSRTPPPRARPAAVAPVDAAAAASDVGPPSSSGVGGARPIDGAAAEGEGPRKRTARPRAPPGADPTTESAQH